jgi:hypothetical protein
MHITRAGNRRRRTMIRGYLGSLRALLNEYAVNALSAAVCLKTKPAGEPPAFNFFAMI